MNNKNKTTAGAAIAAAPVSEAQAPNQTAATAAEAGSPIIPAAEEAGSSPEEEEAPTAFDVERFNQFLESLDEETFAIALDAVLDEAHHRGVVTGEDVRAEAQTQAVAEAGPADEHAEVRALVRANRLEKFWQDAEGNYHFDAAHAKKLGLENLIEIAA
jgi:hypothetical protein